MDLIFDQLTDAIRQQLRDGKTQAMVAQELNLAPATISAIARGYRRLGRNALEAIMTARPPWVKEILGGDRS